MICVLHCVRCLLIPVAVLLKLQWLWITLELVKHDFDVSGGVTGTTWCCRSLDHTLNSRSFRFMSKCEDGPLTVWSLLNIIAEIPDIAWKTLVIFQSLQTFTVFIQWASWFSSHVSHLLSINKISTSWRLLHIQKTKSQQNFHNSRAIRVLQAL